MNLEQIALLGIGVFAFMALVTMFNTARTIKKVTRRPSDGRPRRLIASPDPAEAVARSVVTEVRDNLPFDVKASRKDGSPTPGLEKALAEAKSYYLSRVEPRYRTLFSKAVSEIIFEDKSEKE